VTQTTSPTPEKRLSNRQIYCNLTKKMKEMNRQVTRALMKNKSGFG
jgi:hypothetical protein